MPGEQLQDRQMLKHVDLSHSRILHAIGRMFDGQGGGAKVA